MNNFKTLRLPVGQLHSNCYIHQIGKGEAIIIDPGDDDQYVIDKLLTHELTPVAMFATHGHFDHVMAGFSLQAAFNIPFYIHKDDNFLMTRMRETAIHFKEVDPGPPPIATFLPDSTTFDINGCTIQIIPTPGHTPGSVSYFIEEQSVVFVGDLVFADGSLGEVSHQYSDRPKIKASIKEICELPEETIVYPGHEEETTILELREKVSWALDNARTR